MKICTKVNNDSVKELLEWLKLNTTAEWGSGHNPLDKEMADLLEWREMNVYFLFLYQNKDKKLIIKYATKTNDGKLVTPNEFKRIALEWEKE